MRHTLKESAKLAGIGLATLYRHLSSGKLSKGIGADDKPYIETSELIRCYGELRHDEPATMEHGETVDNAAILEELRGLRALIEHQGKELKRLSNRLEYKPVERIKTAPFPLNLVTSILNLSWLR